MMEIAKKKLLLTTSELTILSDLLENTIHTKLFEEIKRLQLKTDKSVYRVNKDFFEALVYTVDMCPFDDLLLKTPKITTIKRIRDFSKTQFSGLRRGNYYVRIDKSNAFIHKWEAKIYSYGKMIKELEKKALSLKTDTGKEPYLKRLKVFQKKIDFINAHPERLV